ncbi:MAG: corrinoid protein [Candidatus Atabeyarchaeum deiterrae]
MSDDLATRLKEALIRGVDKANESEALDVAKKCVKAKVDSENLVKSISESFRVIGEKYEKGLYYLPELVFAGTMAQKVLDLLSPVLKPRASSKTGGKIVLGTVRGDLHDLGKNILALMLRPAGFNVIDLGNDVPPETFVETIRKENAKVLGMSALLSTTRGEMTVVIEELKKHGLRSKVKVVIGGGAVNESFAKEIGADAYGKDPMEAIRLCNKFLES